MITHLNQPLAVLLNQSPPKRKQVRIRLIGRNGNRDAIGATLIAETSSEKSLHSIVGGGSYLSTGDRTLWLTIPEAEKELTIHVRWPKGGESSLRVAPSEDNQTITVIEPARDQGGR